MTLRSHLVLLSLAVAGFAHAESTLTITGVHNCCGGCDKGIKKAIAKIEGAKVATVKDKVTITADDEATAKRAAAAMVAAGYFGEGAEAPAISDARVKSATVSGVHLCCGKCVTAARKAAESVAGVTKQNASKGATSFTVEGDFSTQELAAALHKNGLHGSIK